MIDMALPRAFLMKYIYILMLLCLGLLSTVSSRRGRSRWIRTATVADAPLATSGRRAGRVRAAAQQRRDVEAVNLFIIVGDATPGAARVQRELMGKGSRCYGTAADVPWRYNEGSPASL